MDGPNWTTLLIGALTGGVAGTLLTFGLQRFFENFRVWNLSRSLTFDVEPVKVDGRVNACRIRVGNRGTQCVENAIGYITLTFDQGTDVLPNNDQTFIPPNGPTLSDDRLSWALADPKGPNPFKVDIFPGENQGLDVVKHWDNKFEIASEEGFYKSKQEDGVTKTITKGRVYLKPKRYDGTISIVGKNIVRRTWRVVIEFSNSEPSVKVEPTCFPGFWAFMIPGTACKDC